MKKIITYIVFFCLTGLTVTSGLPVTAGGCESQITKKKEIKCNKYDKECQTEKGENYELNKTLRS